MSAPHIAVLPWSEAQATAAEVRRRVFIIEQGIAECDEWDAIDHQAHHAVLTTPDGQPLATGRVWADAGHPGVAHIGRMAVMPFGRGQGWGREVLLALMQQARHMGCSQVSLNAQLTARQFYEKLGYVPQGDVFDDVGIAHVQMVCTL